MKRIFSTCCALLLACGGKSPSTTAPQIGTQGVASDADASQALKAASDTVGAWAQPGSTPARDVSGSATVTASCESGTATATVNVTAAATGAQTSAKATYDWTATGCVKNGAKITGSFTYSAVAGTDPANPSFTIEINGSFAYEGPKYSGTFTLTNFTLTATRSGDSVTVTAGGSYSIGGVTHKIDQTSGAVFVDSNFPAPSTTAVSVDMPAACPAFTACGGEPLGTYDYTGGCINDELSKLKLLCATIDTSSVGVTVSGSLYFVAGAVHRIATVGVSGTINIPALCVLNGCANIQSAITNAGITATCSASNASTAAGACSCAVSKTTTIKDGTTFSISGNNVTTADGETYQLCAQADGSLTYSGPIAKTATGNFTLKKRQ